MSMTRFPDDIVEAVDATLQRFFGKDALVDPALAEAVAELIWKERQRVSDQPPSPSPARDE